MYQGVRSEGVAIKEVKKAKAIDKCLLSIHNPSVKHIASVDNEYIIPLILPLQYDLALAYFVHPAIWRCVNPYKIQFN
jgi:hypothetical protein